MISACNITKSILVYAACFVIIMSTSCQLFTQRPESSEDRLTATEKKIIQAHYAHVAEVIKFKKAATARIAVNEKIINEYKISISNKSKSYTAEYKEPISLLDRKNCAMKKRMSEYKEGGSKEWLLFKKEFSIDMEAIGKSLNDSTFAVNN
ncbi:MAG: hypothetical protein KA347_01160 [Bacteroidia bacterium]|jgi:hypothetical protein|nr:hypothetical protein [Bacteroidia bacterium]MBP7243958.1 hypothetical protein [Bacteroidia bacterium]